MLGKKIDQDVGRLSKDGAKALSDIQATRLAIFNAQPDQAKTLIHQAKVALAKAAKDDAVFMKPESELTAPGKATTPEKVAHAKAPSTTPVARLPVDSQLTLEQTTADVTKAASLIDEGKYYDANAVLKDATDHAMLNIVDVYGQPYKAKAQKTADAKAPVNAQKATTSAN